MTLTHGRWAIPSIDGAALKRAHETPGTPQPFGDNQGLPAWCTASLVWDVDGVLLLEVLAWRPGRNPHPIMSDLADQLSALGWKQAPQPSAGPLPWARPDGVTCPGAWSTWVTP